MNPWIGWTIAVLAVAVGWQTQGWLGVMMAASVIVFWLLLQFTRVMRVMRVAGQAPVGRIESAVMLHAKLHAGMPMLDVLRLTRSLGRKLADEPETFVWTDAGGVQVRVGFERGRCRQWVLLRPDDPPPPAPAP
jgi:Flp pilus assembly protein TadB